MRESAAQRRRPAGLSKSRLTLFEQCPKRLWLNVHRPELAQEAGLVSHAMREGNNIGAVACSLYPDGQMIDASRGLAAACDDTRSLLESGWRRPIFEGTFSHEGVLVRVDMMLPTEDGWHIAEVKGTTGVKAYHLADLATQIWVIRENGVRPVATSIRHLNRQFRLEQIGDYTGLFVDADVGASIDALIEERPALVAAARDTLAAEEPQRDIGDHCNQPFPCSFQAYCGKDLPQEPEWPTSLLPDLAGKKVAAEWAGRGINDLTCLPLDAMPTPKLWRIHEATLSGQPWHDAQAILAETQDWAWPRLFLDFETIQFAIPRWVGTIPYEQVPFQFSAHVQAEDRSVTHHAYLSIDGSDPRRACAQALVALPNAGSIIAWNASFERGCIRALARQFGDLAPALDAMADRVVDLLPVVRCHYYHRDMRGSWSIKAVLPTIAPDLAYDGLDGVANGTDAQLAYFEAISPACTAKRRAEIEAELLVYCALDTEAIMILLDRLASHP